MSFAYLAGSGVMVLVLLSLGLWLRRFRRRDSRDLRSWLLREAATDTSTYDRLVGLMSNPLAWAISFIALALATGGIIVLSLGEGAPAWAATATVGLAVAVAGGFVAIGVYWIGRNRGFSTAGSVATSVGTLGGLITLLIVGLLITG